MNITPRDIDQEDRKIWNKIANLDLEPIIFKLVNDRDVGDNWTLETADAAAMEYRKYLFIYWKYGHRKKIIVSPSYAVDSFWHQHILDTAKYRCDCEYIFASTFQLNLSTVLRCLFERFGIYVTPCYIDHFPYFGMRGDEDLDNLKMAFDYSQSLLEKHFA